MKKALILCAALFSSCAEKKTVYVDDQIPPVGSLEYVFNCTGKIASIGNDEMPDPVRGFEIRVKALKYKDSGGAVTMESDYTFAQTEPPYKQVNSKVFGKEDHDHTVENELLKVTVDMESKEAVVMKKYHEEAGHFALDCQEEK